MRIGEMADYNHDMAVLDPNWRFQPEKAPFSRLLKTHIGPSQHHMAGFRKPGAIEICQSECTKSDNDLPSVDGVFFMKSTASLDPDDIVEQLSEFCSVRGCRLSKECKRDLGQILHIVRAHRGNQALRFKTGQALPNVSNDSSWMSEVCQVLQSHRLFYMFGGKAGFLDLGPPDMLPGDKICTMFYYLYRTTEGNWRVAGEPRQLGPLARVDIQADWVENVSPGRRCSRVAVTSRAALLRQRVQLYDHHRTM
jgi:hypothetical protein